MTMLNTLPFSGKLIITIILLLFSLAISILLILKSRYKSLYTNVERLYFTTDSKQIASKNTTVNAAISRYKLGYFHSGSDINTPAIIDGTLASSLKSSVLMERFIKNVVSLLITLGLLGTFIGLTMAVGDLASMFDTGEATDVLATFEIVGSGLLSSLSGMGIAFTTSLIGIGCSIAFTLLNILISPMQKKEQFIVSLEDYMDNVLAPTLKSNRVDNNQEIIKMMEGALGKHSLIVANSIADSSKLLMDTTTWLNDIMQKFGVTCDSFNSNVRDFSEFNHHLRNNIERMDVNFIKLVEVLKERSDAISGKHNNKY